MSNNASDSLLSFLTFTIDGSTFAINTHAITSIIEKASIYNENEAPVFVKGIINAAGKILPVIDMRNKLGLDKGDISDTSSFLIICLHSNSNKVLVGLQIHSVGKIIEIESLSNSVSIDSNSNINKMQYGNDIIQIVNHNKLLNDQEFSEISFFDKNRIG
jgi:purine-binding chemotaxis protein CheW